MQLTIWNLTGEPIDGFLSPTATPINRFSIQSLRKKNNATTTAAEPSKFLVHPNTNFSTQLSKSFSKTITFLHYGGQRPSNPLVNTLAVAQSADPPPRQVQVPISSTRNWKVVPVAEESPWNMFLVNVSRTENTLMVFQNRDTASFLSTLPDRLPLSSLLLPATHDTLAFYGWPIAQCQNVPLSNQLKDGIRVIDIRLAVIPPPAAGATQSGNQDLVPYHGILPEATGSFLSILADVHNFLTSDAGRNETIVMSIKQEDASKTPPPFFSQKVREFLMKGPGGWSESAAASGSKVNNGMWFLENRIPTLGEVRGKVVLFSRFGGDGAAWPQGLEGIGIHPTTWPDSSRDVFEWDLKGTRVRTYDWYEIPSLASIPEKVQRGTANLLLPRDSPSPQPILPITYFSAASFPLALPPSVATGIVGVEGVNSLLGKWLLNQIGSIVVNPTNISADDKPTTSAQVEGLASSLKAVGAQADNSQSGSKPEPRIRGWAFLDFYADPSGTRVVPLLIECNFLGRMTGEEGW